MTKIIAIPENKYGNRNKALHFKSFSDCAVYFDVADKIIRKAFYHGTSIHGITHGDAKNYYIDEDFE